MGDTGTTTPGVAPLRPPLQQCPTDPPQGMLASTAAKAALDVALTMCTLCITSVRFMPSCPGSMHKNSRDLAAWASAFPVSGGNHKGWNVNCN
jgi:hypothetical protein